MNPESISKAKRYVKRYRIRCTLFALGIILVYCAATLPGNGVVSLVALIFSILAIVVGGPIIFNISILALVNRELDPETYLAAVYLGRFDSSAAPRQLFGEYFCCHYPSVVAICEMKLKDPKIARRHRYHYLTYLANVYFDIGDDGKLREVITAFQTAFAKEKMRKQAKIRARFSRMTFYECYLKGDTKGCYAWVNAPVAATVTQYHRFFCKARLALLEGKGEEALRYYEILAKDAPQLNYGKLAAEQLALQGGSSPVGSFDTLAISEPLPKVTLYPAKRRNLRIAVGTCLIAFALLIYAAVSLLEGVTSDRKQDTAYRESIRLLVEEDHDGVAVLDTFTLKSGKEVIDTMFICRTDKDIIVGCTYVYRDDPTPYYKNMTDISIPSLSEDRSPLWYCSFPSETSHYQIESYFYTVEGDIPEEYLHLSAFEIDGQWVYYVITETVPDVVITLP